MNYDDDGSNRIQKLNFEVVLPICCDFSQHELLEAVILTLLKAPDALEESDLIEDKASLLYKLLIDNMDIAISDERKQLFT